MSAQKYTDEQREEALDLLRINRNNVALTSHQTGVPERTLREWRRSQRLQKALPPYPPSPAAVTEKRVPRAPLEGIPLGTDQRRVSRTSGEELAFEMASKERMQQFSEPAEAFEYVYERFLAELVHIADTLPDILSTAPPYHQLLTLMQMIDRIEKLHGLIPKAARQQTIRIEYVDPDGSLHDTPVWQRDSDDPAYP